jgi:hypothetical protein
MITLAVGEQKELNAQLVPLAAEPITISDIFITSNYDPPTAADDYIHARVTNNDVVTRTIEITARRWESWMDSYEKASRRRQTLTINPGETVEYHEHIHGNDYTIHDAEWWLTGDWTLEPLTPHIPVKSGYHLTSHDEPVEAEVLDVSSEHVVILYAQYGVCNKWEHVTRTPPHGDEQRLDGLWYTDRAYCGFWYIPCLLAGRTYESHLKGGTTANREFWLQFDT